MKRFKLFGSRLLFWMVAPWVIAGVLFFPYLTYREILAKEMTGIIIASGFSLGCMLLLLAAASPERFERPNIFVRDSDFDERIFEAVECATPEKPHDLVQILAYVDARERLLLSHGELANGLGRLIKEGRIVELTRHKFYGSAGDSSPRNFSGLTPKEYREACEAYHEWFWKTYKKLSLDAGPRKH